MELRICLWLSVLFFVLSGVQAKAEDDPLKDYKPITGMTLCRDVMLPCILAIPKTADLHFIVFSKDGKLVAITKIQGDREVVVWGELKLPLRKNEREL